MVKSCYELTHPFLRSLDDFLRENLSSLTCRDIHDIYYGLFDELKKYRGTSGGFTGLSELLVFRCLYHALGGRFERIELTKDVSIFRRGDLSIGQSMQPSASNQKRLQPDILIETTGLVRAAVEIKVYLVNGIASARDAAERLSTLKKANPECFRGLLLVYHCPDSGRQGSSSTVNHLCSLERDNAPWFHVLVLGNNRTTPFINALSEALGLRSLMR